MSSDTNAPKSTVGRLVALIIIVIALFLAMKFLPVQEWLGSFNDWVGQMGVAGIFISIGVYAVATVLLAPGVILTIGASSRLTCGKVFAVSAGDAQCLSGLLVARFIARDKVEAIAKRKKSFWHHNAIVAGAKLVSCFGSASDPIQLSNYFYGSPALSYGPRRAGSARASTFFMLSGPLAGPLYPRPAWR
jgi:hypothetical protein